MASLSRCASLLLVGTVCAALWPQHGLASAPPTPVRAHQLFDQTHNAPPAGVVKGGMPIPLRQRRVTQAFNGASSPEVFGFAQSGEVLGNYWPSDLQFNLLSTVAYFGVNINPDGSLVSNDSGYAGWTSQQMTSLINTAHANGVRVVLTVKAFDDYTIGSATGSESNRNRLYVALTNEVKARNADGVAVDFEGISGSLAQGFSQFIGELRLSLNIWAQGRNYLVVSTYASSAEGGTMFDVPSLSQNIDAFDVMAYDFTNASSPNAGPVAPMNGYFFTDTRTVSDFLSVVPASQVLLGVPYYGYKWSVTSPAPQASVQPGTSGSGDTYAGILADLACAPQVSVNWDPTFAEPWATWWSPPSGDPCGGNHNSWRELYYDNAASLGVKYDLVNARGLRGIGIWALGMDSGSNDLWNEIAAKLVVAHGPTAHVQPLPAQQGSTAFPVSWAADPGSVAASTYVLWSQSGGWGWTPWLSFPAHDGTATFYGWKGIQYEFWLQAIDSSGHGNGPPPSWSQGQAVTSVPQSAPPAVPFNSLYSVDTTYGSLIAGASPPMPVASQGMSRGVVASYEGGYTLDGYGVLHPYGWARPVWGGPYWPGFDIARGVQLINGGESGYILDGWGGVHPFGGAAAVSVTGYWPGWDIARGLALNGASSGYTVDGWGGVHPFGGAPPVNISGYWPGWDIARGIALRPDGVSGFVVDGWGGLHPFGVTGDWPPVPSGYAYWQGFDIARGVTLIPGSWGAGYTVDGWGGIHPFGGAPWVPVFGYHPGIDTARGISCA